MLEAQCMGCMGMYDYELDTCPHCGFKESEYKKIGYHLKPHTTLADTYIVGKSIGYGGFGITYVGYNAILEKKVAIKEYLPGEFATRNPGENTVTAFTGEKEEAYHKGLAQFEQEAKRLAKLRCKSGIVDIYDCFRENNTVYIVMECLEGETLKELLKREKKLSVSRATDITADVLRALQQVHSEGIIHRDISPENIFITSDGEVKLIDFGAARNATTGHSKSLSVIVKQGYAPPEQYYSRGKQGPWTDVYAVAATYYRMLTGVVPEDSMERSGEDTLVPPSKLKVRISKARENALMNALVLDTGKRTATVEEFLQGITGEDSKVKLTKVKKRKADLGRIPLRLKLGIALGAIGVIIAFVLGYQVVRDNMIEDKDSLEANQVYVPNVLNMSYDEAEELLKENGLDMRIEARKSADMPYGIVIEQDIAPGEIVDKGTQVALVLSNGGVGVYIEDYVGMSKEEVITKLDQLQLYGEFEEVESSVAPGIVISQSLDYNDKVQRGTVINFQVSAGKDVIADKDICVPQLEGMTFDEGIELLDSENLYIKQIKLTYSSDIPKGQIISQSPEANQMVKAGSIIEVEVSGGVELLRIPVVAGKKITDAEALLNDMGFETIIDYDVDQAGYACTVIRLDVEEGAMVEKGSTITIYGNRGVTFEAYIISPDKEFGNVYKVGDEIKITVEMKAEDKGINGNWEKEFGFKYNDELLEYNGAQGNATVSYIRNHEEYGNALMINYRWSEDAVTDTVTLSFTALKEGEDEVGVFLYQTWLNEEKTSASAHLWNYAYNPYEFTFFQTIDHLIDIEIE